MDGLTDTTLLVGILPSALTQRRASTIGKAAGAKGLSDVQWRPKIFVSRVRAFEIFGLVVLVQRTDRKSGPSWLEVVSWVATQE
jgi:hypothetical protein